VAAIAVGIGVEAAVDLGVVRREGRALRQFLLVLRIAEIGFRG
jgi:hypothetical protein